MEKQKEKIMKFSKIICILLSITIGVFIAIGVLTLLAWLLSGINLPTEILNINGVDMEVPYLFKLGDTKVFMPVIWKSDFDFSGIQRFIPGLSRNVGVGDFIGVILIIIVLRFTKMVFKLLKENGSPFREDIIKQLKRLAIVLLITGSVSGVVPFLASGIVWVLCLIFDYGRVLQNESDMTL